jgi:hypothetical protein
MSGFSEVGTNRKHALIVAPKRQNIKGCASDICAFWYMSPPYIFGMENTNNNDWHSGAKAHVGDAKRRFRAALTT